MRTYIIAVNPMKSDVDSIFNGRTRLYWIHRKGNHAKYEAGDVLYMYISSPIQKIRFKVKVLEPNIGATLEQLANPTWINQEDVDEQVRNNNNDKIEIVKEVDSERMDNLSLSSLCSHGLSKRIWGSVEITDNEELVAYIESVFES